MSFLLHFRQPIICLRYEFCVVSVNLECAWCYVRHGAGARAKFAITQLPQWSGVTKVGTIHYRRQCHHCSSLLHDPSSWTWSPGPRGHGKRFRRNKGASKGVTLSTEDIEFLRRNTRYNELEIREWHRWIVNFVLSSSNYPKRIYIFLQCSMLASGFLDVSAGEIRLYCRRNLAHE